VKRVLLTLLGALALVLAAPSAHAQEVGYQSFNVTGVTGQTGNWQGFSPLWIPGVVLWLRSDLGITKATGVSTWADQSGHGYNLTQATGSEQPTYPGATANGIAGLGFSATASSAISSSATGSTILSGATSAERIIVAVNNLDPPSGTGQSWENQALTGQASASNLPFTNGGLYDAFGATARTSDVAHTGIPMNTPWIYDTMASGASGWTMWLNSVQLTTITNTFAAGQATDLNLGDGNTLGTLYEYVVFGTALTAAQRFLMTAYASNRYGIAL
jgi:hypothetical protein